jgi:hypothetical protein
MSTPIPKMLVDAFADAVARTGRHWHGEDPDAAIINLEGQSVSVAEVSSLATAFDDPIPEEIYKKLSELGFVSRDHSFEAGARFLLGVIKERKTEYESKKLVRCSRPPLA